MSVDQSQINRLVSLTFDENPKVRREAAKSLAEIDDPAALFALVELSYDKDAGVRKVVQDILQKKKSEQHEVMSFAELFSAGSGQNDSSNGDLHSFETKKDKVLTPITQLFERKLGKEKAEAVKNKMMPTIQKVYMRTVSANRQKNNESGKKAIQEFLTSYLEAISDLDSIAASPQPADIANYPQATSQVLQQTKSIQEHLTDELGEVGTKSKELESISKEVYQLEEEDIEEKKEEEEIRSLPDTLFKKAYETMMLSGGDDKIMRSEMKRMVRDLEKDVRLAYALAKKKFKELKITHISKIKNGMRNVNSDVLIVRQVENSDYLKGKLKKRFTRLVVNDEDGNEGIVYLFDDRGVWLKQWMKIKITRGQVKAFDFSGETAIIIGKKGSVSIIL